jgi:hypothetical protein
MLDISSKLEHISTTQIVNTTKFQNLESLVLHLAFSYREHGRVQVHIDVLVALLLDDLILGLVGSRYP